MPSNSGAIAEATAQICEFVGSAVGFAGGKFTDLYCFAPDAEVPVMTLIPKLLLTFSSITAIAKRPLSC